MLKKQNIKLTNVSTVKYAAKGKHFQIACYAHKIQEYQLGMEKDTSNILQIEKVFSNVARGLVASNVDLIEVFGTSDVEICTKIILDNSGGSANSKTQLSDLERSRISNNSRLAITAYVCTLTVNPMTKSPYTPHMITKILSQLNYNYPAIKMINTGDEDVDFAAGSGVVADEGQVKKAAYESIRLIIQSGLMPIEWNGVRARLNCTQKIFDGLGIGVFVGEPIEPSSNTSKAWVNGEPNDGIVIVSTNKGNTDEILSTKLSQIEIQEVIAAFNANRTEVKPLQIEVIKEIASKQARKTKSEARDNDLEGDVGETDISHKIQGSDDLNNVKLKKKGGRRRGLSSDLPDSTKTEEPVKLKQKAKKNKHQGDVFDRKIEGIDLMVDNDINSKSISAKSKLPPISAQKVPVVMIESTDGVHLIFNCVINPDEYQRISKLFSSSKCGKIQILE